MDERKKRVVRFFAIIYLLFGAALLYLIYFNTGLEIKGNTNPTTGDLEVSLKNSSIHLIRDINIFVVGKDNSESNILSLSQLRPSEEKKIPVSEAQAVNGVITIKAKAVYHLDVSKTIQVGSHNETTQEFSAELSGPNKTFVNALTKFNVILCSSERQIENAKIKPEIDSQYFDRELTERIIAIEKGSCKNEEFSLTPKTKGKTTIAFNITIGSFNKRLEKEMEILD